MKKEQKTPSEERYDELFRPVEIKAEAFDKIAEMYYYGNFGTMSKADLDVLLFSIYLERILEMSEEEELTYDDYTMSKLLGITQARVRSLKERKELRYPYAKFDWKKSFLRICENASYDKGKIVLHISDRNLYLEVKHAIESKKGIVDLTLNSSVLRVKPTSYFELLENVIDDAEIAKIKEQLRKANLLDKEVMQAIEKDNFATGMKKILKKVGAEAFSSAMSGGILGIAIPALMEILAAFS